MELPLSTLTVNPSHNEILLFVLLKLQLLGSFATERAAPRDIFGKLLLKCNLNLEGCGAEISAMVNDGATTNKKIWKSVGIIWRKRKSSEQGKNQFKKRICYIMQSLYLMQLMNKQ